MQADFVHGTAKVLRFSPEALAAWVRAGSGAAGDEHAGDVDAVS
jgi:hypothetical protein